MDTNQTQINVLHLISEAEELYAGSTTLIFSVLHHEVITALVAELPDRAIESLERTIDHIERYWTKQQYDKARVDKALSYLCDAWAILTECAFDAITIEPDGDSPASVDILGVIVDEHGYKFAPEFAFTWLSPDAWNDEEPADEEPRVNTPELLEWIEANDNQSLVCTDCGYGHARCVCEHVGCGTDSDTTPLGGAS